MPQLKTGVFDPFHPNLYADVPRVMERPDESTGRFCQRRPDLLRFEEPVHAQRFPEMNAGSLQVFEIRDIVDVTEKVHLAPVQAQFHHIVLHLTKVIKINGLKNEFITRLWNFSRGLILKKNNLMKTTAFLFAFACSSVLFGQHGGALLSVSDNATGCYYDHVQLIVSQDTLVIDTVRTDDKGEVMVLNLPAGKVQFRLLVDNAAQFFDVTIQPLQLLSANIRVSGTTNPTALYSKHLTFVPGTATDGVVRGSTITRKDLSRVPVRRFDGVASTVSGVDSEESLEEIVVMSYRLPLITCQFGLSSSIIRSDLYSSPAERNSQIPLITGGAAAGVTGTDGAIQVRGSRADATAYYIDGVKVRGNASVPHSSIQQLTIYTGGIPANYGDVTGGVISIETKSQSSYNRERNSRLGVSVHEAPRQPVYREPEPAAASMNKFLPIYENMFLSPLDQPHSTFGTDVDQASWKFIQRCLENKQELPRDAVKLEEMVNAFDHHLPAVEEGRHIALTFEQTDCPWNTTHSLVAIRLRAEDLPVTVKRKPHNFVFLVDVSGSMMSPGKLDLLKQGLISLVENLQPDDRVSLVTYAGSSGVALQPTLCSDKRPIVDAIARLESGGSTNGIGGIRMAYELAAQHFLPGGNNRIILATDGDFNVGINNPHELEAYISQQRGKGIYLTALGFGMDNYRSDILETLADRGDGNHFYISDLEECREVLEKNVGNLLNLARDVKLNVEFNPELVANYRLIGYENRLMPSSHFRDDTKDGGEMGYGHCVVAVYEIEPGKAKETTDTYFVKSKTVHSGKGLCRVSLRYKLLDDQSSVEETYPFEGGDGFAKDPLLQTIIAFGLELRDSAFKGTCSPELVRELMAQLGNSAQETELKRVIAGWLR